jgi:hypothetical protein
MPLKLAARERSSAGPSSENQTPTPANTSAARPNVASRRSRRPQARLIRIDLRLSMEVALLARQATVWRSA